MIVGKIVLFLVLIGCSLLGIAWLVDRQGNSPDEKLSAVIPGMIGLLILAGDGVLVFVYALYRLFFE